MSRGADIEEALEAERDAAVKALEDLISWLDDRATAAALAVTQATDETDDDSAKWYGGRARAFREAHREATRKLEEA